MKKCMTLVLTVALLTLCAMPAFADIEESLIVNKQYDDPIINAIANVQRVQGDTYKQALEGEENPGVALCEASELESVAAFIQDCSDNRVLPVISVRERKEAEDLIRAVDELGHKDVTVVSDDPSLLKYIRNKKLTVRTGLYVALESDSLTSEDAHAIRTSVRSAPATFCVIDVACASRQVVAELQELAVAVWVEAGDDDVSVLKAITSGANGVISANACETAALMNEWFQENTMTRTPIMIGHRGNPTQAPENSLIGFLTAYENGCDVFELDVEITKDGEIIIMHDNTLNRTTNYKGESTVSQMTLEEIKQYRLLDLEGNVSEETVPTFREVLETFMDKDCRIFVEFKGYNQDNVRGALEIVKEYGMEDRIDVISFNSNFLKETQKEIEGMSTGLLQSPSGIALNALTAVNTFYSSIIATQEVNSTINPGLGVATEAYIQTATDRGMTVWPWTYTKGSANKAFLVCPDGITTDDVQWSKDMPKYIETAQTVTATPGKSVSLSVNGTTYGRETSEIEMSNLIVNVIDGEEVVKVENGELVALENGTARVMFGYQTETPNGSTYVLYTQPVTIEVGDSSPMTFVVIVAIATTVMAVVFVILFVILKKKAR